MLLLLLLLFKVFVVTVVGTLVVVANMFVVIVVIVVMLVVAFVVVWVVVVVVDVVGKVVFIRLLVLDCLFQNCVVVKVVAFKVVVAVAQVVVSEVLFVPSFLGVHIVSCLFWVSHPPPNHSKKQNKQTFVRRSRIDSLPSPRFIFRLSCWFFNPRVPKPNLSYSQTYKTPALFSSDVFQVSIFKIDWLTFGFNPTNLFKISFKILQMLFHF